MDVDRLCFLDKYRQICNSASDELFEQGVKIYDKMTDGERDRFLHGKHNFRLAKTILCSIDANKRLWIQFGAEAIKSAVRSVKRISKRDGN